MCGGKASGTRWFCHTCEINWELREFTFCVGGESVAFNLS